MDNTVANSGFLRNTSVLEWKVPQQSWPTRSTLLTARSSTAVPFPSPVWLSHLHTPGFFWFPPAVTCPCACAMVLEDAAAAAEEKRKEDVRGWVIFCGGKTVVWGGEVWGVEGGKVVVLVIVKINSSELLFS